MKFWWHGKRPLQLRRACSGQTAKDALCTGRRWRRAAHRLEERNEPTNRSGCAEHCAVPNKGRPKISDEASDCLFCSWVQDFCRRPTGVRGRGEGDNLSISMTLFVAPTTMTFSDERNPSMHRNRTDKSLLDASCMSPSLGCRDWGLGSRV